MGAICFSAIPTSLVVHYLSSSTFIFIITHLSINLIPYSRSKVEGIECLKKILEVVLEHIVYLHRRWYHSVLIVLNRMYLVSLFLWVVQTWKYYYQFCLVLYFLLIYSCFNSNAISLSHCLVAATSPRLFWLCNCFKK